jgi:PAS domain S-box-containing protein
MKIFFDRILPIFLLLAGPSTLLHASEPIPIEDFLTTKNISRNVEYIEDIGKKLSINDIAHDKALKWTRISSSGINFGYSKSQFWLRFTVDNKTKKNRPWLLEVDFPLIDLIELFVPDGKEHFHIKKTGYTLPFNSRDMKYINYIFKMNQKPGKITFFMRIDSLNSINFNLNMLSYDSFLDKLNNFLPVYWLFFGLMIVMALYNLFIFASTREREHIYFASFVVLYALFEFNFKGFASQYLWPNATWWPSRANPFLVNLFILVIDLFIIKFIGLRERYPKFFWRLLPVIITLPVLFAVLSLFIDLQMSLFILYVSIIGDMVLLLAIAIYMGFFQRPPSRQARIAMFAFFIFVIMVPIVILTMLGMLPSNFFTRWALQLGASIAVVLLSIGIADKINFMKNIIQIAERKYRHLVESTNDIIFTLDENNLILTINGAVKNHLGYDTEEVIHTNFLDLIQESWSKNYNIAQLIALEYISDLKNNKKGSVQFRTTVKDKYSHEPKELSVSLEYTGDKDTGYAILGKASRIVDDALTQFLVTEQYEYDLNNYFSNADLISQRLSRNLYRFATPSTISSVRVAIREAIINAIEHGNLGLTFEEKTKSQLDGTYFDLIKERQFDSLFKKKKVTIEYSLNEERAVYKISDEGAGFDYFTMMNFDPENNDDVILPHGRGLILIQHAFDIVKFNKKGNQIILVKHFKRTKKRHI